MKALQYLRDIVAGEAREATRLGNPLSDPLARERRMNAMATLSGGKGFRVPPLDPATDAQGTTRGQRRRATAAYLNAFVSEARPAKYMHSHARRLRGGSA